jgi:hypothetical protein
MELEVGGWKLEIGYWCPGIDGGISFLFPNPCPLHASQFLPSTCHHPLSHRHSRFHSYLHPHFGSDSNFHSISHTHSVTDSYSIPHPIAHFHSLSHPITYFYFNTHSITLHHPITHPVSLSLVHSCVFDAAYPGY